MRAMTDGEREILKKGVETLYESHAVSIEREMREIFLKYSITNEELLNEVMAVVLQALDDSG